MSSEFERSVRSVKRFLPWFEELYEPATRVFEEDARHERESNYWRFGLLILIGINPLAALYIEGPKVENLLGAAALLFALLYCLFFLALLPRWYRPWVRYVTVTLDVTLVSGVLLGFIVAGRGLVTANSQVTFPIYFLVLAMIAQRYDVRLAVYGALLLLVEYASLVAMGWLVYGLPQQPPDPEYGAFSWPNQVGRALLLSLASVVMLSTVVSARRLREIGLRDHLTGVFNRRYFLEVLSLEFDHSREIGRPLAVAMVDVDGFKRYNDTHGHPKGDRVLVLIADFLARNLRRSDLLARYGGDEFVVLLLETPTEGAGALISRIQERAGIWLKDVLGAGDSYVNLSFGLSSLVPGDAGPMDIIRRADEHLYKAKKAGGGVVCDEGGQIIVRRSRGSTQQIETRRKSE
jgi:diguanylate cyclase (GGDEF)-like protein